MLCCIVLRSLSQDLAPAGAQPAASITTRIAEIFALELPLKAGLKSLGALVDECVSYQKADALMGQYSPLRAELDGQFGHVARALVAECMALLDNVASFPGLLDFSVVSLGIDGGYDAFWQAGGDASLLIQLASEAYVLSYAILPYLRFLGTLGTAFIEFRAKLLHHVQESYKILDQLTGTHEYLSSFIELDRRAVLCTLKQFQHCKQQMQLLMMPGVVMTSTGIIIPGVVHPAQLLRPIFRTINTGPPLVLSHLERAQSRARLP